MGNNLFGANISGRLQSALGPLLNDVTLIKKSSAGRDPNDPSGGTVITSTRIEAHGIEDPSQYLRGGKRIVAGSQKFVIIGDDLGSEQPAVNDEIEFAGKRYLINDWSADPDRAVYEVSARGLGVGVSPPPVSVPANGSNAMGGVLPFDL